jgi:hypothetical protein
VISRLGYAVSNCAGGGIVNDNLGPVYVWQIMTTIGLLSTVAFPFLGSKGAGARHLSPAVTSAAEGSRTGNPGSHAGENG